MQFIHHNTLIVNILSCFYPERDCQLVYREKAGWDCQHHLMLLVQLFSIVHVDTLSHCVTVPGDAIYIAIQGYTHTRGIHLTKVNLSLTHNDKHLVTGSPIINLVQVELDSKNVRIHWSLTTTGRNQDRNRHCIAARTQQTQKVGEVVLIEGGVTARAYNLVVILLKTDVHFTCIAWTGSSCRGRKGGRNQTCGTGRWTCGWHLSWK